jgi:hypothetical protein
MPSDGNNRSAAFNQVVGETSAFRAAGLEAPGRLSAAARAVFGGPAASILLRNTLLGAIVCMRASRHEDVHGRDHEANGDRES